MRPMRPPETEMQFVSWLLYLRTTHESQSDVPLQPEKLIEIEKTEQQQTTLLEHKCSSKVSCMDPMRPYSWRCCGS